MSTEKNGKTSITSAIPVGISLAGDLPQSHHPSAVEQKRAMGDNQNSTSIGGGSSSISPSKKLAARRTLRLAIPKLQHAESMQQQQQQQQYHSQKQNKTPIQQTTKQPEQPRHQYNAMRPAQQNPTKPQHSEVITRLIQNERNANNTGNMMTIGAVGSGRIIHSDGSSCSSGSSSADNMKSNAGGGGPDNDGFLFKSRMQDFSPSANGFDSKG